MIITTSHTIEGRQISEYLGIVSAAQVFALPGGNKAVNRGWQAGVESVIPILKEEAQKLNADAIISVCFLAQGSSICATGTAVKL